ncbi:hypothetical protein V5N11_015546 [Cardamine amara subsp. amara]|uniref:Retrotransposon gag domain-containing protein n=1 Tax=Cardamine amara subsp. amara TaxID=228776 RepID=A0ABD0ZMI2_CARAN
MTMEDMVDSDQISSELQDSVAELNGELTVLRGGWKRLTDSYSGVTSRVAAVESRLESLDKSMSSISQTLARMETNQWKDKAQGKQKASSSSNPNQVHSIDDDSDLIDNQLGYRGIHNILENRNGLLKKIELPVFDGTRPYGWITQAERFFRLGNYNDADKLDLMSVSLQGPILNWYNREIEKAEFQNWSQFKKRMIARFSQKLDENPRNRLFSMKQTGSIVDYVNEFEELSTVVKGVDEENLVHVFYLGLKPEMQEVIKIKEPHGLTEHFNAVMRMEDSAFCTSMASTTQHTQYRRTSYIPLKSSSQYNSYRTGILKI